MLNKKAMAWFLIAIFVIITALTGCSTSGGNGATKDGASVTKEDPFGKYSPAIEITTVKATPNPATVKYASGESASDNPWTKQYEDELGIKVKYKWMVDASQWQQKSNLMIASGDLPDFFKADLSQFTQLLRAGQLSDMTEVYEKYASPYTVEIMTEGGNAPLESAKYKDKLMAIPFTGLPNEGVPILFLRTDWLKKLNIPEPKNLNDLFNISQAFTKNDPDGNGKDDTIGIILDKDIFSSMHGQGIAYGYHAYPNAWIKDKSGKLVYGSIQPEMKKVLEKMQELYKSGQIDKEFGTKDIAKVYEDLTNGKVGIFCNGFWSPLYPIQSLYNNDSSTEWKSYPIPSIDEKPAKSAIGLGVLGYWVVRKGAKNPEAIVKMLNVWTRTFYGNKDDDVYHKLVNGADGNEIWQNADVQCYRGFKNLAGYYNVNEVIKGTKTVADLTPEERETYTKIKKFEGGDKSLWCWGQIYGPSGSMGAVDYYKSNNLYIQNEFYGAPTKTAISKGATLGKLEQETFTKIIKGASLDEFDKFVTSWKKLGGDDLTQEVNEWYKSK